MQRWVRRKAKRLKYEKGVQQAHLATEVLRSSIATERARDNMNHAGTFRGSKADAAPNLKSKRKLP